ncbi:hypothetical protein [Arenimonas alkanexedens]
MKALLALLFIPGFSAAATVSNWSLPAPAGASQPHLSPAPGGDLLLSWIERRDGGGHRLRFARSTGPDAWTRAGTIAEGEDWFVNWADVPALQALPDGSLWAHTLVKNGEATYAYDVRLQVSRDGGRAWRPLGAVHDDGTPTEHGFATLWPQSSGQLGIAWLDGRRTAGAGGHDNHDDHANPGGAMTLRAARFGASGEKLADVEIDAMTCDCCPTDSAISEGGVLLVYRDRSEAEVRDIHVTRFDGRGWTPPVRVNADQWVMPGCPVNGPAIAARGAQAWVAWYTGAGAAPSVRIARSGNGGDSFGDLREVAAGDVLLGRVDLATDAQGVWMSWLQEADGVQSLWLARFSPALDAEHFRVQVAQLAGRGRATGVPRLQLRAGDAWLVWTDVVDGQPQLRGARVQP